MNPFVVRAPAALGAILGIVAIWVHVTSTGGKYWDGAGHAIGISMLVLVILVGVGLVLATWLQSRALDQAWLLPALVLGGLYLFFPIGAWGEGATGRLGEGAWLGVAACALFVLAGILNALPVAATAGGAAAPSPATESPSPGWYPDPKGEARLRYWDGKDWTETTAS